MKKAAIIIVGVVAVLVIAVIAAPRLIDWNGYKPEIAEAVRDATGRDLTIEGDIRVSILPALEFEIAGIRLANVPGAAAANMVSIGAISGKIALFPLLGRRLVVERLVISEPAAYLEVDKAGRPNWALRPAAAAKAAAEAGKEPAAEEAGLPLEDIQLGDVRIENGLVSYVDAVTGQRLEAKEINVAVKLAGLASRLSFVGRLRLNGEKVALDISLDTPLGMLSGERAGLRTTLASRRVTAGYAGRVQLRPVPGLDGAFDLDVPSVGKLAAWLGRPLDASRPDPGPLTVHAVFAGDGAKVALKEARIEGKGLKATARGSFDGSGEITKVTLEVESGVLDLDRYLPPPAKVKTKAKAKTTPAETRAAAKEPPADILAALSDRPLDLTALRRTEADVKIAIGGIKAMGFEIGRVAFTTVLKGGVLKAELQELALYGGKVAAKVGLDGSADELGVDVALSVRGVRVDKLAQAADGEVAVTGVADATLKATARGASPRALAETLVGNATLGLGGVDIKDAPAGAISELKVTLDLPGLQKALSLKGRVVYNKRRVDIDLTTDALKTVLSGERFAAKVRIESKLVTARYDGRVQQRPVPGLDGAFDLDVPSVGRLAAWLGGPLDPRQPDPGPLKVRAVFAGEGAKITLKEARIAGKGLTATVKGSFDGSGEVAKVALEVESGVLDIDRYLPPPEKAKSAKVKAKAKAPAKAAAAPPTSSTAGPPADILAALPNEPLDLSALRRTEADVKLSVGGVKAMGFEVGRVALTAALKGGVLTAELRRLALYGGEVRGTVTLDGSGKALGVDAALAIDRVRVGELARAAGGDAAVTGVASGTLKAKARGASPRALAQSLVGNVTLDLGGIDAKDTPAGAISELKLALDLPGLEKSPSLKGRVVYNKERLEVDLTTDPLKKVLSGGRFAAKLALASKLVNARYDGRVQQRPVPGLDGVFELDVPSVGRLAAWLGQPLDARQPDPGPIKVRAVFAGDGARVALEEATIEGKALKIAAKGSFDGSGKVKVFDAKLAVREADLNAYLPPPRREATLEERKAAKPRVAEKPAAAEGWSEEPLDLAALRTAKGNLEITLGSVRYRDLHIRSGVAMVALANGVLRAKLAEMKLDTGSITANATVDASGNAAVLSYQASVDGVEARPFLKTFAGSDRLSGKAFFEAKGKARGRNQKELVGTLNGDGSFKFLDGAIHGINLAAALRQAKTLGFSSAASERQKTDFAELSGSFVIKNGILENRDFKMLAPLVRLSGSGVVPMPPRTVDYKVVAKLVGTLKGQGGQKALSGLPIPVSVTGPWSNPKYGVDWASVFSEAAMDPARLKAMPANLREAAKGFGVKLPIPALPGAGALPGLLKAIPGRPEGGATQPAPKEGSAPSAPAGVGGLLQRLLPPKAEPPAQEPAPAPETQKQEEKPPAINPLKTLKGLFGN